VGSLLYSFGGFAFPFYVLGGIACFSASMTVIILPQLNTNEKEEGKETDNEKEIDEKTPARDLTIKDIFKVNSIIIAFYT